jgi:hypothetical protein
VFCSFGFYCYKTTTPPQKKSGFSGKRWWGGEQLYFSDTRGNEADKDEVFAAAVHELVLFIAGNENHRAAGDGPPFTVLIDLSFTGMDEYFVLPRVRVPWGEPTGSYGEYPHTKVIGCIFLADDNPAGDAFDCFTVKFMGGGILVVRNFHNSLITDMFLEKNLLPLLTIKRNTSSATL